MRELEIKALKMTREVRDLNWSGQSSKETINMEVEKLQELAPELMDKLYDQTFSNCTADVGIDSFEIDITVITEEKYHWANEDPEELVQDYAEELIALMEYMKEVG